MRDNQRAKIMTQSLGAIRKVRKKITLRKVKKYSRG
jgi:hypothetical protein